MTLRDVRNFVRHDRSQFIFIFCPGNQAGIHADVATWQRERIDRVILDDEKVKVMQRTVGMRYEAMPEIIDVFMHDEVIHGYMVFPDLLHNFQANFPFLGNG